jgi:3-phenylpropionate/trans-cinnamate dioxygenase ferredoxin reductase subunit
VPWFWSDQASYKLQIAGITTLADHVHAVGSREAGKIVAYCFRGDRLIGIEAVNSPSEYLLGRRMLEHDVTIVRADVERRDFDFRSHLKAASG